MTIREAATQVLQEAGQQLHVKEITKRILGKGLWTTTGKTPESSISANLYSDIKKNKSESPFIRHSPNTFGLRSNKRPAIEPPQGRKTQGKKYSFPDSAAKVLEMFGKRMHYRDITDKGIENGWIVTEGRTPKTTMSVVISREIDRNKLQGKQPRFVQHGRGFFGLSKWEKPSLIFEIDKHNKEKRKKLHGRLLNMKPEQFEQLIGLLLAEIGFDDIEVTKQNGDQGIDVRGTLVVGEVIRTRMAIQAKRWKDNVQSPIVQQVRGSLGTHDQGLIITTSDFSPGACREAERQDAIPVALMNGEQLIDLLVENEIWLKRRSYNLLELDDEDSLTCKHEK